MSLAVTYRDQVIMFGCRPPLSLDPREPLIPILLVGFEELFGFLDMLLVLLDQLGVQGFTSCHGSDEFESVDLEDLVFEVEARAVGGIDEPSLFLPRRAGTIGRADYNDVSHNEFQNLAEWLR